MTADPIPPHRKRWDSDERGYGASDARSLLPDLDALRSAMSDGRWIAEEPELYLGDHIRRICNRDGAPLRLTRLATEDAVLILELEAAIDLEMPVVRAEVLTILGAFVEASTFVRESNRGDGVNVFDAVTGMLDGDGAYAGHGHLVRFVVTRMSA